MCGRARCTLAQDQLTQLAGTRRWVGQELYQPSYNVGPGRELPVIIVQNHGEVSIQTMRWGLVPSFTKPEEKPDYFRMFNAKSETVAEKPSFRRLLPSKRCLVPLEGFYEWKQEGFAGKQPYYIHLSGDKPMVFAGLWDVWHSQSGPVHTFTILTTDSSKRLQWLHDRMPVILRDKAAQQLWLGAQLGEEEGSKEGGSQEASSGGMMKLMVPYNGEDLVWHPVTPKMSHASFQGPECCKKLRKATMKAFFSVAAAAGKAGAGAAPEDDWEAAGPAAALQEGDLGRFEHERQDDEGPASSSAAAAPPEGAGTKAAATALGPAGGGGPAAAVNTDQQPADAEEAQRESSAAAELDTGNGAGARITLAHGAEGLAGQVHPEPEGQGVAPAQQKQKQKQQTQQQKQKHAAGGGASPGAVPAKRKAAAAAGGGKSPGSGQKKARPAGQPDISKFFKRA